MDLTNIKEQVAKESYRMMPCRKFSNMPNNTTYYSEIHRFVTAA